VCIRKAIVLRWWRRQGKPRATNKYAKEHDESPAATTNGIKKLYTRGTERRQRRGHLIKETRPNGMQKIGTVRRRKHVFGNHLLHQYAETDAAPSAIVRAFRYKYD
jgi:hypothetical protein